MKRILLGVLIGGAVFLNTNTVMGDGNMITSGKTVKFDYVLTVQGEVVDSSEGKAPLEYKHGQKMIIPGLESQLEGLKVGDKKDVIVAPEDAYGPIDQKAILEVPKSNLGPDIDPQPGMVLQMTTKGGQPLPGKIVEVKGETIVLDFNHPLAGQELHFAVEIVVVE